MKYTHSHPTIATITYLIQPTDAIVTRTGVNMLPQKISRKRDGAAKQATTISEMAAMAHTIKDTGRSTGDDNTFVTTELVTDVRTTFGKWTVWKRNVADSTKTSKTMPNHRMSISRIDGVAYSVIDDVRC